MDPKLIAHALKIAKKAELAGYHKGRTEFAYAVSDALDYLGEKIDAEKAGLISRYTPAQEGE